MSIYVVLNCEDWVGKTALGAAADTVQVFRQKREKPPKCLSSGTEVVEHRCIENNHGVLSFVTGQALTDIQGDCRKSKKIYLVLHGDPRHTDSGFSNRADGLAGVTLLGDYNQIAAFMLQAMPTRKDRYNLGLIMCYGARCSSYLRAQIDHRGQILSQDLATSFAYKLFKVLCQKRKLRMTAVTGKISHDTTTNRAMVENELLIDEAMAKSEKRTEMIASKGPLHDQFVQFSDSKAKGQTATYAKIREFKQNPLNAANDPFEIFAKSYAVWETTDGDRLKAEFQQAQQAETAARQAVTQQGQSDQMSKYGKFVYTYENDKLKIINKYGSPGTSPAGMVLYRGPLL